MIQSECIHFQKINSLKKNRAITSPILKKKKES